MDKTTWNPDKIFRYLGENSNKEDQKKLNFVRRNSRMNDGLPDLEDFVFFQVNLQLFGTAVGKVLQFLGFFINCKQVLNFCQS